MTQLSASDRLSAYERTLENSSRWLTKLRLADGSFDVSSRGGAAYTPLPVYCHATGDAAGLLRALRFIEHRCRDDADNFLGVANPGLVPYRAAWLLEGAMLGEHLAFAQWIERWMLRFVDARTGGLFGNDQARQAGEGQICFDSSAMACAALCVSGQIDAARRIGDFLRQLIDAQPDVERRVLCTWDTRGNALHDESDPAKAPLHVIEWRQPRQHLYKIGLLVRALALLHARSGDAEYLQLAERIQQIAVSQSPQVWKNTFGHKLAWSAYTLAILTRRDEYVEQACRMADHLATLQQHDGTFAYPEWWPELDRVPMEIRCNIQLQFSTWVAYARNLLRASPRQQ